MLITNDLIGGIFACKYSGNGIRSKQRILIQHLILMTEVRYINCAPEVKAQILASMVREVWPKVEIGGVKPTIYKVLPIQEAETAHDILYRGENLGKVVLTVDGD